MELTLLQGLALTLMGFVFNIDQQTEAFYWFRPIVVCFVSGIIVGDVGLGLACGAVTELAYLGMTMVGGNVPPDPLFAGAMTTVIAYTTGQSAEAALGLSYPFALLAQAIGILFNTVYSVVPERLDGYAKRADDKGFLRVMVVAVVFKALVLAILMFLCTYAMQVPIRAFVDAIPAWTIHGLEVAGGILPAVGLAMLMLTMLKGETAPYVFLGFVLATFVEMPNVLPVAIVGCALAAIDYMHERRVGAAGAATTTSDGGDDDGI